MNLIEIKNYEDCTKRIKELKAFRKSIVLDHYSEEWIKQWVDNGIKSSSEYAKKLDWTYVSVFYFANMIASLKYKQDVLLELFEQDEELHNFLEDEEFFSKDAHEMIISMGANDDVLTRYPEPRPYGMDIADSLPFYTDIDWVDTGYALNYIATDEGYKIFMRIYREICNRKDEVKAMINEIVEAEDNFNGGK